MSQTNCVEVTRTDKQQILHINKNGEKYNLDLTGWGPHIQQQINNNPEYKQQLESCPPVDELVKVLIQTFSSPK